MLRNPGCCEQNPAGFLESPQGSFGREQVLGICASPHWATAVFSPLPCLEGPRLFSYLQNQVCGWEAQQPSWDSLKDSGLTRGFCPSWSIGEEINLITVNFLLSALRKGYLTHSTMQSKSIFKICFEPLAGVAQFIGASSHNRKVAGSVPSQGTYRGGWFNSWSGPI